MIIMMKGYVFKFLLYIDILFESLIWRDPGITISARCGLALRHGNPWFWCKLGKALNWIEKDHCEMAIQNDIDRAEKAIKILKEIDSP